MADGGKLHEPAATLQKQNNVTVVGFLSALWPLLNMFMTLLLISLFETEHCLEQGFQRRQAKNVGQPAITTVATTTHCSRPKAGEISATERRWLSCKITYIIFTCERKKPPRNAGAHPSIHDKVLPRENKNAALTVETSEGYTFLATFCNLVVLVVLLAIVLNICLRIFPGSRVGTFPHFCAYKRGTSNAHNTLHIIVITYVHTYSMSIIFLAILNTLCFWCSYLTCGS